MNYIRLQAWARIAAPFVALVVFVATWLSLDFCCGCAGILPWSEPSREVCGETDRACMEIVEVEAECRRLDDSYLAWKAVGMALSGLTGATGTGGILTATLADEPAADVTLAGVSAGSAIMATVAQMLSSEYAQDAVECLQRLERLRAARDGGGP